MGFASGFVVRRRPDQIQLERSKTEAGRAESFPPSRLYRPTPPLARLRVSAVAPAAAGTAGAPLRLPARAAGLPAKRAKGHPA